MSIPEISVPLCPTCGDPVTSGCYPADGICAVVEDEQPNVNAIEAPGMSALTDEEWAALGNVTPRYMMATKAIHKLGDISRDEPDLAWITGEDGDNWTGQWITGYGYIDVRFPKATTRDLTAAEREDYAGRLVELNGEVQPMLTDENAVDQCPHCTSDRKDFRFVMPTKGAVTPADVAPCGNAWHDETSTNIQGAG